MCRSCFCEAQPKGYSVLPLFENSYIYIYPYFLSQSMERGYTYHSFSCKSFDISVWFSDEPNMRTL